MKPRLHTHTPAKADLPPGTWEAPSRCRSHQWHTYKNLVWRPQESEARGTKERMTTTKSDVIRVRVPLSKKSKVTRRPGALEICCGHAGLTASLCDAGIDGVGVDWGRNRHQPCVPILNVNLTTEDGQRFVKELVSQDHLLYVHLAPPCGTYTRARERPIPAHLRKQNAPCPQPLRSEDEPEGFSPRRMSPLDALKVEKGNIVANFCAEIADL